MPHINERKLSLCIVTYNRSSFLTAMLDSILPQVTDECEIVVSDNASTDDTREVVSKYLSRCSNLRYLRQTSNKGFDRNVDSCVQNARGQFCWLLADDDVLRPGAISAVLDSISAEVSLILVNFESMDFTLTRVIQRGVEFEANRSYEPADLDKLFEDAYRLNSLISSCVVRRDLWLTRDREPYFGTSFVQTGVIYQHQLPGKALIIAKPIISMRMGNVHAWWSSHFDICMRWRPMIESFALSESTKRRHLPPEPWKSPRLLLWERAIGAYSWKEYRQRVRPKLKSARQKLLPALIARTPYALIHVGFCLYWELRRAPLDGFSREWHRQVLRESRVQEVRAGRDLT